jgi:adenosylcobinamide-GDP ribazoletransferase
MPPRTRRTSAAAAPPAAAATDPPPQPPELDRAVKNVLAVGTVAARGSGTAQRGFDPYERLPVAQGEWRVFWTAVMFLTRLPVPRGIDHHAALLMRAVGHFPLVGIVVGTFAALWYSFAALLWTPTIAACAACLSVAWLTGCFHHDGLCDSFDGFGGGWTKDQILTIMQDSRVGTYALVGVMLTLSAKIHATALLAERAAALQPDTQEHPTVAVCRALIAAECSARWTCVVLTRCCHYVTDPNDAKAGIYNWFAESGRLLTNWRVLAATAVSVGVPSLLYGGVFANECLLIYAVVIAATVIAGFYGNMMIGGVIGDFLGATVIVTETAIILALGADWERARRVVGAAAEVAAAAWRG